MAFEFPKHQDAAIRTKNQTFLFQIEQLMGSTTSKDEKARLKLALDDVISKMTNEELDTYKQLKQGRSQAEIDAKMAEDTKRMAENKDKTSF